MFEGKNEKCVTLVGKKILGMWLAKSINLTEGQPSIVNFDYKSILEREDKNHDIIGWVHSHPNWRADPSITDDNTMHAWVCALGRPLLCGIDGTDGMKFWLYFDDKSSPILVKHIRFGKFFCGSY